MSRASVIATSGTNFAISSENGDMISGTTDGFYSADTRFLSEYILLINNRPTEPISVDRFDSSTVSFYCEYQSFPQEAQPTYSVVRDRSVGRALHEDIYIRNESMKNESFNLSFSITPDFADVFEVRRGNPPLTRDVRALKIKDGTIYEYRRGDFERRTRVSLSNFSFSPESLGADISLQPKTVWQTCVRIAPGIGGRFAEISCNRTMLENPFGKFQRKSSKFLRQRAERTLLESLTLPEIHTENSGLRQEYYQAIYDLSSLELEILPKKPVLAAGLPWFMTLFGRDSAISAIQTKLLGTSIMVDTVETLASMQATDTDAFRESQPGKIPHEVRHGELSIFEEVPHSRYYGSIDSTPLFVMLLWEAFQWTGDMEFLKKNIAAGERAISWIDKYGDLDGDGFVEYVGRGNGGLKNQGWKDSNDSVSFESGELAEPPIALSEVQGYVYAAKIRMADLYRILGEVPKAEALEKDALKLKEKFNSAFWLPKHGFFALALDGIKNRVDSIASDPGHCLWTKIVDDEKAPKLVRRLMEDDLFSGWGIRTLSTRMTRYNPLSYHNGSVWPHDNSLICSGMASYGFYKEANTIAFGLFDAANSFPERRLPELFAGYVRREHSRPVPYPAANSPQAWASGAIIYCIETLLGLAVFDGKLMQRPRLEGVPLSLTGVNFRGTRIVL